MFDDTVSSAQDSNESPKEAETNPNSDQRKLVWFIAFGFCGSANA
jgi:hypothetical protein